MFGKISPRQMQQAMRKMGIAQEDIEADEVIIKCPGKTIIIKNPSVAKVKAMGQEQFTISGEIEIRGAEAESRPAITEEDIKTVAGQAGVSEEKAKKALEEAEGDIAKAIMELQR